MREGEIWQPDARKCSVYDGLCHEHAQETKGWYAFPTNPEIPCWECCKASNCETCGGLGYTVFYWVRRMSDAERIEAGYVA